MAEAAEDKVLCWASLAARPVRRGWRERSSQRRNGAERRTNGEEDVVRLGGWGVTPAAGRRPSGEGRDGRKWPSAPTHLRPSRPSSLDRAPRGHARGAASSPFRLRSLRCSVVNSVAFATSCSRPPQLLGSRSDHHPSAPMLARPATPEYTRTVRGWRVAPRPGTCAISACEPRQGRKAAALSRH